MLRWPEPRLRIGCSTTELPRPLIIKDLFPRLASCQKTAINLPSNFHRSLSVSAVACATFDQKSAPRGINSLMHFCWQSPSFPFRNGPPFQGAHSRMRLHTASQKDPRAIVALADSFRKLLSLRILASCSTFSFQRPMRMPNNGEIGF